MHKVQEYIVKGKRIFVGLEDSKRTWKLCVRSNRIIVHEVSMPARYEHLRSYLLSRYPACTVRVMYESGFSGFWLHDRLQADGISCIVTPASRVTMEKVSSVKTDKRDARRLAKNLENGDYVQCHVPDAELREDRSISRALDQMQRDLTRTKNRIRRFLDFHGLNGGLKSGAWCDSDYRKLEELSLGGSLGITLSTLLATLTMQQQAKADLKNHLKALCEKKRYRESVRAKMSIPGIGWLTAIRLTLEWGDMNRFPSGKHLASYAGLTAREYSSGDTVRRGRITGQGSDSVRAWLIQCAWRAIRKDPVLLTKFQNVWRNSGSKKKAIVAVARKITVRLRVIELDRLNYCLGVIE
jgi:transposase